MFRMVVVGGGGGGKVTIRGLQAGERRFLVGLYNRVGQYEPNLRIFNVFIIRQPNLPPKVPNKQIFADPYKNSQRKIG